MKTKKIVSLSYSENSLFCHPKTMEEFEGLKKAFLDASERKDIPFLIISACQLIPDIIEVDEKEV